MYIAALLAAILRKKVYVLRANTGKMLYAKKNSSKHLTKISPVAILKIVAMLAAILKIQVHELGANVEKIPYANNPIEIWESNQTLVSSHFEYSSHVGRHFEKNKLRANVEIGPIKELFHWAYYAKINPSKFGKQTSATGHFEYNGHVGNILKKTSL